MRVCTGHNYADIILILAMQMVAETVLCPNHPESDNIISTTHDFPEEHITLATEHKNKLVATYLHRMLCQKLLFCVVLYEPSQAKMCLREFATR